MTLKVVEPIEVTEAVLAASDIPEPDTSQGEVEWEADRFEGYLFDVKSSPQNTYMIDAAIYQNYIYVVEGFGRNEPGLGGGYVHRYNLDGSYSGLSFTTSNFTTGIEVDNGKIFTITIGGFVQERDLTGTVTATYDIQADVTNPVAICSNNAGGYNVLDFADGEIVGYDASFNTNGFKLKVGESGLQFYGLTNRNGNMYYVNQATREVVGITTENTVIEKFNIAQTASEYMSLGSIFFDSTNGMYVLSEEDNRFYKYEYGVYSAYYMPGDRVIKSSTHQVYQCLTATSQDPEEGATDDAAATWIVVGPTNKWAMFDDQNSTTTKSSGSFSVELDSSEYIMAYGVTGSSGLTSVRCQVYDSGENLVYDDTQSAIDTVGSPGDFIYASEDVFYKKKLYQTDIPPTDNFKVVFTFNGSDIEIGNLTVGPAIELGPCLADSKNESLDLSEQTFDDFGNETYIERPIITFATYETISSIESSNVINRFLNVIRRKGCLWIGEVGYNQSIVTFGRIERDPIPYTMPTEIRYTIRVRGFA